jgi:hypothetical protein
MPFPFDQLPGYLLRDRDAIYGRDFREQVRDMGIEEVFIDAALSLATSVRGTGDWLHSAGMSRPCDRVP